MRRSRAGDDRSARVRDSRRGRRTQAARHKAEVMATGHVEARAERGNGLRGASGRLCSREGARSARLMLPTAEFVVSRTMAIWRNRLYLRGRGEFHGLADGRDARPCSPTVASGASCANTGHTSGPGRGAGETFGRRRQRIVRLRRHGALVAERQPLMATTDCKRPQATVRFVHGLPRGANHRRPARTTGRLRRPRTLPSHFTQRGPRVRRPLRDRAERRHPPAAELAASTLPLCAHFEQPDALRDPPPHAASDERPARLHDEQDLEDAQDRCGTRSRASTWDEDITPGRCAPSIRSSPAERRRAHKGKFRIAPAGAGGAMIYWAAVGERNGQSWLEGFSVGDEGVAKVLDVASTQLKVSRDQGGQLQQGDRRRAVHRLPHGGPRRQERGVRGRLAVERGRRVRREHARGRSAVLAHPRRRRSVQPAVARDHDVLEECLGRQRSRRGRDLPGQLLALGRADLERLPELPPRLDRPVHEHAHRRPRPRPGPTATRSSNYTKANAGKELRLPRARRRHPRRRRGRRGATTARRSYTSRRTRRKTGASPPATPTCTPCPTTTARAAPRLPSPAPPTRAQSEYYPAYSPDDKYIAFDRAPGSEGMYYNPHAEVFVVPAGGGKGRFASNANDPPACTGATTPGITNSWAKWSPQVTTCSGGAPLLGDLLLVPRRRPCSTPANLMSGGHGSRPRSSMSPPSSMTGPARSRRTQPCTSGISPRRTREQQPFNGGPTKRPHADVGIVDIPPPTVTPK